jgi:hypothetical protein
MKLPEQIGWADDDVSPVVAVVAELQRAGAGWVNLDPVVDPDDQPAPRGGLGMVLSRRGPDVPRATWVAAPPPGRPSIGIQHGSGHRAMSVLADFHLDLPTGVRLIQDNPRRGLVAEVDTDDVTAVLEWLVAAATALATVTLTGAWRAEIHRR